MRLPTPAVVGLFLGALSLPAMAQAEAPKKPATKEQEEFPRWTVSGTFYTDMSAVEADKHERNPIPQEGITGEFAMGATYHADKNLSVTVRACVGCHSFELQSAYADWQLDATWSLRAGRIPVPFGGFSRRTDPSHVESATKPLAYIMGGMVRQDNFNMGIVPAPYIDNGAGVTGNFWVSQSAKLSLETALVRGLKGISPDVDFDLSREYQDSNGEPAVATRVLLTADPVVAGASVSWGRYDPDGNLDYLMGSVELQIRFGQWNLRLEGIVRETDYFNPGPFAPSPQKESYRKTAYIAQIDGPIAEGWRVFLLNDFIEVDNIFLGPAGPSAVSSPLTTDDNNTIMRVATGFVYSARAGIQFKGSVEFWDQSDFEEAIVFHLGVVAIY